MTSPKVSRTTAKVGVSWSLSIEIEPGSVPDRRMPYSSTGAMYRPNELLLGFHAHATGAELRPFNLGSAGMTGEARRSTYLSSITLKGYRVKADGTAGTHLVNERLYNQFTSAPDWAQHLTGRALDDLVRPI